MSVLHNHNSHSMAGSVSMHHLHNYNYNKSTQPSASLALARTYGGSERSIFRAAKELCRFVMTTIVVANASKCTANAASIIANYHRTAAARSSRNGNSKSALLSGGEGFKDNLVKENNINLWHFRTFSTCSAGSPFDTSEMESVFTSEGRSTRKNTNKPPPGSHHQHAVHASSKSAQYYNGNDQSSSSTSSLSSSSQLSAQRQSSSMSNSRSEHSGEVPPSLEELRAQLGPVGLLVANAVEVGVTTASSYISGGLFGYVIGGAMGAPGILKKSANINPGSPGPGLGPGFGTKTGTGLKEIQRRIGDWNSKAVIQGKSWGALSASFSGFHALARVCRGGVEDRWNSIIGSAATGAYLSRHGKLNHAYCIRLSFLIFGDIFMNATPTSK